MFLLVIVFLLALASAGYWMMEYANKDELSNDSTIEGTDIEVEPEVAPEPDEEPEHPLGNIEELLSDLYS